MPALLAFAGGLLTLIAGGGAIWAGLSGVNAATEFLKGDHQAAKRHAWGTGLGSGVLLCAAAIGQSLAGLPHA